MTTSLPPTGSIILYAVVALKTKVVAESTSHSPSGTNFSPIIANVLKDIPQGRDSRMSYAHDKYLVHYAVSKEITYLCIAPESFGRRIPFAFLEEIEKQFPFAKNATEFVGTLQKQMELFNKGVASDKITKLQKDINEVKDVMVHNIDKLIERGESIDCLVSSTGNLVAESAQFHAGSRSLRKAMWLKNAKMLAVLVTVVSLMIFLVVVVSCGGFTFKDC